MSPAHQLRRIQHSVLPSSQLVDVQSPAVSAKWAEKLDFSINVYLADDRTVCSPMDAARRSYLKQPIHAGQGLKKEGAAMPYYKKSIICLILKCHMW